MGFLKKLLGNESEVGQSELLQAVLDVKAFSVASMRAISMADENEDARRSLLLAIFERSGGTSKKSFDGIFVRFLSNLSLDLGEEVLFAKFQDFVLESYRLTGRNGFLFELRFQAELRSAILWGLTDGLSPVLKSKPE